MVGGAVGGLGQPGRARPQPVPSLDPSLDLSPTLRFAEQFVVDVAGMPEPVRAGFLAEQGAQAFAVAQVIWVLDWTRRAEAAWAQLDRSPVELDRLPEPDPAAEGVAELWPAVEAFMADVARLDGLDPVTTELVRLRGARAHDCRLCRSRRFVQALEAGADEATFDQVDHYETSDLEPAQQVALRLTDALIWTPSAYPAGLAEQVAGAFTADQQVELVLDVVRNSANKIAVAFAADQAQVPDGQVELYDIAGDGQVVYGLSRP